MPYWTQKIFYGTCSLLTYFNLSLAELPPYENLEEFPFFESIERPYGIGSYLSHHFLQRIPQENIHCILEIGSRDAVDAAELSDYYKTHVFCFECNPEGIALCQQTLKNNPNVTLIPKAVWNENGMISFYPIINCGNIGASSCYKISSNGSHVGINQKKIEVEAIRLDHWLEQNGIEKVNLLCIDAQGATLPILQGLGDKINNVDYIITEVIYKRIYEGEQLYPDIKEYLTSKGFTVFFDDPTVEWNDVLFIRNDLLNN